MANCTYTYYWEGSWVIVFEYYQGRFQHKYVGEVKDNGASVDISRIKGHRSFGEIPYEGKRLLMDEMVRVDPPRRQLPPSEPAEEYDPTAWHCKSEHECMMEGVQLSF